jgi:hypothetical protein
MSTKSPNLIDKHVGNRMRMRRVMLGMSQEKLGEALLLNSSRFRNTKKVLIESAPVASSKFPRSFRFRFLFYSRVAPRVSPKPRVRARRPHLLTSSILLRHPKVTH